MCCSLCQEYSFPPVVIWLTTILPFDSVLRQILSLESLFWSSKSGLIVPHVLSEHTFHTVLLSVYLPVFLRPLAYESRCYVYPVLYSFPRIAEAQQIFIELNLTLDKGKELVQILALSPFKFKVVDKSLNLSEPLSTYWKMRILFSTVSVS